MGSFWGGIWGFIRLDRRMAFWSRWRQTRLTFELVSKDFKRCYTINHHPFTVHQSGYSRAFNTVQSNPNFNARISKFESCNNVRFYAAPFQANKKKEEKDSIGPRLNEEITAPTVGLVSDECHIVVSRHEALVRAKNLMLDLVEVDRNAQPPVCKIFDYHKDKYVRHTKVKERAKSKSALKKGGFKEVRFAAKIEPKDMQIKADTVKRLMESGHRVKCTAIEPTNDLGLQTLLSRFSSLIEDVAIGESGPNIEKKQAFIVARHAKFGPSKKGSAKKAFKSADSQTSRNQSASEPEPVESEDSPDEGGHQIFHTNDQSAVAVAFGPSSSVDRNIRHVVEPPQNLAKENRYVRDPRAPRIPMDNTSHCGVPQMPNQGRQPQFIMNSPPFTSPSSQAVVSLHEAFKQPNSPPKSYGIFSPQNANPTGHGQSALEQSNRYKQHSHSSNS